MKTYYILPEGMMAPGHRKFIRDNPQVVEKNDVVVFGRADVMGRLFEVPKKMGK